MNLRNTLLAKSAMSVSLASPKGGEGRGEEEEGDSYWTSPDHEPGANQPPPDPSQPPSRRSGSMARREGGEGNRPTAKLSCIPPFPE